MFYISIFNISVLIAFPTVLKTNNLFLFYFTFHRHVCQFSLNYLEVEEGIEDIKRDQTRATEATGKEFLQKLLI